MKKMKDLPIEERPRERLQKVGAENLSNAELLAILLKVGCQNKNALELAQELLYEVGGLHLLKSCTYPELIQKKGLGPVKAMELSAVLELGKRIYLERELPQLDQCFEPKEIFLASKGLFFGKTQECFYCFYFNNKMKLLERKLLFMGTLNQSLVHPREIFKQAYLNGASRLVCLHNHPSGDINPSEEDRRVTRSLLEIGKLQGIPLIDHIIVSDDDYYSFYENHDVF